MGVGISADLPSIRPSPFKGEGGGGCRAATIDSTNETEYIAYPLLGSVELQFAIPHSALL
jgi:hypothetical protein